MPEMPSSPDSAARLLRYLDFLAHERRQSPHTLSNYRRDLMRLANAADGRPWPQCDGLFIRRQIARLRERGLSGRSLARTLSVWRGFFDWLEREKEVAANPCSGIKAPRHEKRLPNALSVEGVQGLLDTQPEAAQDERLICRDQAMFELFYSSGLRLAELAGLDLEALSDVEQTGEIRVLGKRSKTRIVPVGDKARDALRAWALLRTGLAAKEESALFVSLRGTRISPRMIQKRLDLHARLVGARVHVHPHMLRHSFASHMLQSSSDLRAVQEMLGHASIASTQVYTHLDFQYLSTIYDAAHPRAKKQKKD